MKAKGGILVWAFLLLAGTCFRAFPQQFIQTNTVGGIFSGDQKLIFALTEPGWLSILINDVEIYRGRGPAFPELGVPWGEERSFFLTARFYCEDNVLAESLSWYIFIDKRPPVLPDMEFRNTPEGLRLVLFDAEDNIVIRAWADTEGGLVFFPDLAQAQTLPADSFHALVWAEDLAGNASAPRPVFFELPSPRVENPVPGVWRNPQMLVISGAEGKSVYWTADGSDPLLPGANPYRGPERIYRDGPVTLRVAWRDSAGRGREYRVEYTVSGPPALSAQLSPFHVTEETALRYPVTLSVPGTWLWAIGDIPRHEGGGEITLRPERLVNRTVALHLCAGEGVYRFAYLLDGTASAAALPPNLPSAEEHDGIGPLSIVSAGRSRAIIWPGDLGSVFFSWEGGLWREGRAPFPLPLEGGSLQWFALNGEAGDGTSGPYRVRIAEVPHDGEGQPRGRIGLRAYGGDGRWSFVSPLLEYTPGMVTGGLAVCDGEDIEWAFISTAGEILERSRADRLAPGAPLFAGFPEGGWTRGPVTIHIVPEDPEAEGVLAARIRYASGAIRVLEGTGSLEIVSSIGEAAEVTVEGRLVDASGNRGPARGAGFILDPRTVFVSPRPLIQAEMPGPPGGMDNPFTSLREALDYAADRAIEDVLVAGTLELRESVTVTGTLRIEGGWQQDGDRAVLVLGEGFFWDIQDGADLTLLGLWMERAGGNTPLIRAGHNGTLKIADSVVTHNGPFLHMDSAAAEITNTQINARISGEQRTAAFSARESDLHIISSRIQVDGNFALVFNLGGGRFSAHDSVFLCAGRRTATVFALNGTRSSFENLTLSAAARDYASVVEAFGSVLFVSGGTLGVSARDTSALLLDNSAAILSGTRVFVEGAFTARALEIRGLFPVVNNSRFYSTGSARRSEVFSGMEDTEPPAGSMTDNTFTGFTHINRRLPAGSIAFE